MTFRFARHTNNLEELKFFYTNVLGMTILGSFEDHQGYNGVFIGKDNANWHLEFTQSNAKTDLVFDDDDILVFYPNTKIEYEMIQERLTKNDINLIKPKNPYWNENGIMFFDPDGYRIVISHLNI